jgi:NAD(P)-dependent dehydrogenase (short-subunit alcohol dehydrogenase family)
MGGTSGIGLATAKRFVAEGAVVFITGRRQAELDRAAEEIGPSAVAVRADSSNLTDLDRLYSRVKMEKGRIDILFANAGIGEFATLGEITEEHYDKTFNTNVKGVLFTVQKALPLFGDGGSIILNASTVASMGTAPWLAEYLHELTVFPNGKHDDQADSTAQFLDWFKKPFPGQGFYEYYRQLAQELEAQRKPQPVKTVWATGSMPFPAGLNCRALPLGRVRGRGAPVAGDR